MNKEILKNILEQKNRFIPLIFTVKQVLVIEKYLSQQKLSLAEKKALYTSINKKVQALELLPTQKKEEYFIQGSQQMLPERILQAQQIITQYSPLKVMVAGSFLYSKKYQDIDIYILQERGYREAQDGEKHLIYLKEKKLAEPLFQSAALISIANFESTRKIKPKKIPLHQLMSTYHEAVINLIQKEEKNEPLRDLIFWHSLFCENRLINSLELKEKTTQLTLSQIDQLLIRICQQLFSKTYLYVELHEYIKTLIASIRNIKQNAHLEHYKNTYEELIYGWKETAAKTY